MALAQSSPHPRSNLDAPFRGREALGGDYAILHFEHPLVAAEARAGQYVMLKAGTSAEPPLRRPFSILATDPQTGSFSVFLKVVGPGSRALCELRPGETAQCLGPLGQPFPAPAEGREALLVAGGYGISPLLFMARALRRDGRSCRVFYGGRSSIDVVIREPFAEIGVPLVASTDDGSFGVRGRVTEPLVAYLDSAPGPCELFGCGPDAMLHALGRLAAARDLPAHVSLDPWMGCGLGTCLGCVVKVQEAHETRPRWRCACTEGPVFDAASVVWPGDDCSLARSRVVAS